MQLKSTCYKKTLFQFLLNQMVSYRCITTGIYSITVVLQSTVVISQTVCEKYFVDLSLKYYRIDDTICMTNENVMSYNHEGSAAYVTAMWYWSIPLNQTTKLSTTNLHVFRYVNLGSSMQDTLTLAISQLSSRNQGTYYEQ